jgi:hypothetical protein
VLDLRDYQLPFFNEPAPPIYTRGVYTQPEAKRCCKRIDEFDAFVATGLRTGDWASDQQQHGYNLLDRHGWRKLVPSPFHPRRNLAAQDAFKTAAFQLL